MNAQQATDPGSSSVSGTTQSSVVLGNDNTVLNNSNVLLTQNSIPEPIIRTLPPCDRPLEFFTASGGILDKIHEKFRLIREETTHDDILSRIVLLTGFGGMGKSSTARKYAQHYSSVPGNEDKVTWIDMDSEETATHSFIRLAHHFKLDRWKDTSVPRQGMDETQVEDLVRDVYTHFSEHIQTGLFIMDHANQFKTEIMENGRTIFGISKFLPQQYFKHCPLFLLTSRQTAWTKFGPKVTTIPLKPWTSDETCIYFHQTLGLNEPSPHPDPASLKSSLDKLNAEFLQGYPLAVNMVATFIKAELDRGKDYGGPTQENFVDSHMVDGCRKLFQDNFEKLTTYKPPSTFHATGEYYEKTIEAVMTTSISHIKGEEGGEVALKILRLIAYLPNELLSVELCHFILNKIPLSPKLFKEFKIEEAVEIRKGFEVLEKYSYVTVHYDRQGHLNSMYMPESSVWIHNLLQKFERVELSKCGRFDSLKKLSHYVVMYIEFFESELAYDTPTYIRLPSGCRKVVTGPPGYFPISREPNKSLLKALKEHIEAFGDGRPDDDDKNIDYSRLYRHYIFFAMYSSKGQRITMLQHALERLTTCASLVPQPHADMKNNLGIVSQWKSVCKMALYCFQSMRTGTSWPFNANDYDCLSLTMDTTGCQALVDPEDPPELPLKRLVDRCVETASIYIKNDIAQMVLPYVFNSFDDQFLASIGTNFDLKELKIKLKNWFESYTTLIQDTSVSSRPLARHSRRVSWAIFRLVCKLFEPSERMSLLNPLIHAHADLVESFWRWEYAGLALQEFDYKWADGDVESDGGSRFEQVAQFFESQGVFVFAVGLYCVAQDVKKVTETHWTAIFKFLELIQAIAYFERCGLRLEMLECPQLLEACLEVARVVLELLHDGNHIDQRPYHFELLLDIVLIWFALSTGHDGDNKADVSTGCNQVEKWQTAITNLWTKAEDTTGEFYKFFDDRKKFDFGPDRQINEIRTRATKILGRFIGSTSTPPPPPPETLQWKVANWLYAHLNHVDNS